MDFETEVNMVSKVSGCLSPPKAEPFSQQSTSAALSMNNHEFKKRRLAVVLADSRLTQKAK